MLTKLHEIERILPDLLTDRDGWRSLDINYHPPRVERVYRQVDELRVYLHLIHPCEPAQLRKGRLGALFHPHPWPSAMRVIEGRYEMGIGYGAGDVAPPVAARLIANSIEYEMTDPNGWHYVRAIDRPALTLMVTGAPWDRAAPRSDEPLVPLPPERVDELLQRFRNYYFCKEERFAAEQRERDLQAEAGPGTARKPSFMAQMKQRPTEEAARAAVEAWLREDFDPIPDFNLIEDGDSCYAFWIEDGDTTSYVHHDLSIEWYGTSHGDHEEAQRLFWDRVEAELETIRRARRDIVEDKEET